MYANRITTIVALTIALCAAGVLRAEPQHHKGTVVSAKGTSLVIKDMAGKDQTFSVDPTTKITVNGKPGRLEDLQETMPIQVTTDEKGKTLAVSTVDKEKGNKEKGTKEKGNKEKGARQKPRVLVAVLPVH
jgi:hypothetical protein